MLGDSICCLKTAPILGSPSFFPRADIKISDLLKRIWTTSYVARKAKICIGKVELLSSNWLLKQFRSMPCPLFCFLKACVTNLMLQFVDFGGIQKQNQVCIGLRCHGRLCVGPKRREAWVSETSGTSIKLSSPNLAGGLFQERIVFVFRC